MDRMGAVRHLRTATIKLYRYIAEPRSDVEDPVPAEFGHARIQNLKLVEVVGVGLGTGGDIKLLSVDPQLHFQPSLPVPAEPGASWILEIAADPSRPHARAKLYVDRGQGFSEKDAVPFDYDPSGRNIVVLPDPVSIRTLRWDPDEFPDHNTAESVRLQSMLLRAPDDDEQAVLRYDIDPWLSNGSRLSPKLTSFVKQRLALQQMHHRPTTHIGHVHRLLLGYSPIHVVDMPGHGHAGLIDVIADVLNSSEFQKRVAQPVLRGEAVWFDQMSSFDIELAGWLGSTLGIIPPGSTANAFSWRQCLARLLTDAKIFGSLERRCLSWSHGDLATLGDALSREPAVRARNSLAREEALVRTWGGFDEEWYATTYAAEIDGNSSPILDYLRSGEKNGRRPNPVFDPRWVRDRYRIKDGRTALVWYIEMAAENGLDPSPLFSTSFYRREYGSQIGSDEAFAYFMRHGWRAMHDPNVAFDARWYAEHHHLAPDVNPIVHYLHEGSAAGREPSPLFRSAYVRRTYGDAGATALEAYLAAPAGSRRPNAIFDPASYLAGGADVDLDVVDACWHYRRHGFREGRDPSPIFQAGNYLERNYDVRESGQEPLAHYLSFGAAEGRRGAALFDETWYVRAVGSPEVTTGNALEHYMEVGHKRGLFPNPLFDAVWYRAVNPGVVEPDADPLAHYGAGGWRDRRNPNLYFDIDWYLERHPDLVAQDREPLEHYLLHGNDLDPGPDFDTSWYAAEHPESTAEGWSPLAHFLHVGRLCGFATAAPSVGRRYAIESQVPAPIGAYASWQEVNPDGPAADRELRQRLESATGNLPKISVVMPAYNTDPALLNATIESVRRQIYADWELCVCDDASPSPRVGEILARMALAEPRVRWKRASKNLGIGGATNAASALATGEVIALLDHDDLLHPHALGELALAYAADPSADIVYTDDDKIDVAGQRYDPQFKPDWSPTLLLGFMYMSHLFSFRRDLFNDVGGVRDGFDGSQDFDLALRLSERARHIVHVPKILYHWRAVEGSTALGGEAKPEAFERGVRAVQEAFDRQDVAVRVVRPEFARRSGMGVFEPVFPDSGPSVTIVIPTRNKVDLLRVCIGSLQRTTYENFDILVVDNESDDPETLAYLKESGVGVLRVPSPPEGFSFAHLINAGVAAATGEYVLLLNNDTEVRTPGWLSQMVGYARMPRVGAVGARLIYADGRLQHGGILHGLHEGMAGHAFKLVPDWHLGHLHLARVTREVSGVTAACLLTPKRVFQEVGGLDETRFRVAYNDVDFCYRLVDAGYSCIQCGSAELYHYEGSSRGFDDNPAEILAMRRTYRGRVDPFYNPNLTLEHEQFAVARVHVAQPRTTPVRALFVSHNFNHEGAPNSLFELATGLVKAGRVEATVISPDTGPLLQRYAADDVPATVVETPLKAWPPREEFEANIRRMAQTFLYSGAEVVVVNTADSFWAVLAARHANLPCLWIIRESSPWQTYYTHFPPHIAKAAYEAFAYPYRVVFVARATMEAWKPLDSRHSFTLIRNGLDSEKMIRLLGAFSRAEARRTMEAPDDACIFICIGTVTGRKGQIDLVQAFAALPPERAEKALVVIVGDRPSAYSTQLHQEVADLPEALQQRVRIIGETDGARSLLAGADVFICASRVESYPRVTLEAMAAGLPLITTGVWGIREQVRPDYNALMYEPGDIAVLSAHMCEMIDDPRRRALFASRSIPVFESLPDFHFMRDSYAALIEQAAGSTDAGAAGVRR